MKTQLLAATVIIALTSTSAFAGKSHSDKGGSTLKNNTRNSLAVGGDTLIVTAGHRQGLGLAYNSGGRAVAGSIYLEGDACACDFKSVVNNTRNNIAIGEATAGSVHVNKTMSKGHGYPRK
jgi:hypothetical protein